jgi:hypothetical protein
MIDVKDEPHLRIALIFVVCHSPGLVDYDQSLGVQVHTKSAKLWY